MKKKLMSLLSLLVLLTLCLAPHALAEENKFYFDKSVTKVFEGATLQPELIRQGDCREEGELVFTSSREKVATVDENGVITGVSKGEATITAKLTTQKRSWKCTFTVTVIRAVTGLEVKEEKLTLRAADDADVIHLLQDVSGQPEISSLPVLVLRMGRNQEIQATLTPSDATSRKFSLTTSDESVVKVSSNQFVPKGVGECIVTVQSSQNPEVYKAYRALVIQPVTGLKITAEAKSVFVGETLQLHPEYSPKNASIQEVTWSSGSEKIATVDQYGVVTGVGKGSVTIRATATDGTGRYATYSVTVKQQPESVELNAAEFTLNNGSYKTLKATVLPNNANDRSVIWFSSDTDVAKVNSSGRVTAVGPGVCVITCQAKEFPSVYAMAVVTVNQLATKVQFPESSVSVNAGESVSLHWTVSPENVTNPAVTFSSSKTSVATVDENGVVYGHKRGEATITVTAQDGSKKKDTIKVKVTQAVEGVHMQNESLTVGVDESVTARAVLEPSDASNSSMTWYSADPAIATVRGSTTKATVTGQAWGSTTITGITEDGGYMTSATVTVGNYDKPLKITDLYLSDNKIKISVLNESNMNITRFYFLIETYDMYGLPVNCNVYGGHSFEGSYDYTLYAGDRTRHGRFTFNDYLQPGSVIGRVVMRITGYRTDDGYSRTIRDDRQVVMDYRAPGYSSEPMAVPVNTPELLPN